MEAEVEVTGVLSAAEVPVVVATLVAPSATVVARLATSPGLAPRIQVAAVAAAEDMLPATEAPLVVIKRPGRLCL